MLEKISAASIEAALINLVENQSETLLSLDKLTEQLFRSAGEFADKGKQRQVHRDNDRTDGDA